VRIGRLPLGRRALALLVAGATFMELLDGTVISTAAPRMARSFGVQSVDISVAITAYLLTVAVLIPLSGWLSDRFGARRLFAAAIAVFTIASVLCAVSTNLPELTVFRVLQGMGGAMMVPVGRLVVLRDTAKDEVIAAIAFLTWPALFAPVLAPAIGGVLTTYASWRWIFLVNVPIGVAAFVLTFRLVPDFRSSTRSALDWIGLIVTASGLGALVYGASLLDERDIDGLTVSLTLGASALLLAVAVWHLRRTASPLVDLAAMKIRTFRITQTGGALFRVSIYAVPFLLPLMFQDDFGWSAAKAGALVIFVFIGNLVIKPATTPLLRRFGFRAVLLVTMISAAIATAVTGLLTVSTPLVVLAVVLVAGGAFRSVGFTCYNTIAFADIEPDGIAHANTLFSAGQQLTQGVAIAFGAVALRGGEALRSPLGQSGSAHLPYTVAFVVLALLLIAPVIDAWRLPRSAGVTIGGGAGRGTDVNAPDDQH
jgi:EmrB/QacA subfamily drug resistance transporter